MATLAPTKAEQALVDALRRLSTEAGSHSPSRFTIRDELPTIDLRVDACFLSNPYATDLFIAWLQREVIDRGELRNVLEFYPSQNAHIASLLAPTVNVDPGQIFVCNGAVEAIQAVLHNFAGTRIGVVLPTFSPYYEYLRNDQTPVFFHLREEDGFVLEPDRLIEFAAAENLDAICLINPNNPNGAYLPRATMRELLSAFADLSTVIIDESFVDFAYEDEHLGRLSLAEDVAATENAVLVKSMSKDFGVAGIRAGYAVMSEPRVATLLENGYLWNIGGLAEVFFRLFIESEFQSEYSEARLRYLREAMAFFDALSGLPGLKTYPSKANFQLVRLPDDIDAEVFVALLLIRHGVYVRDCRDKIGLDDGHYLRIAARTTPENDGIVAGLRDLLGAQ